MNEQFEKRKIQKTYLAIVTQKPAEKAATIKHFLEKDSKNKKALIHQSPKNKAKEVQLHYRILEEKDGQYLLQIHPKTGKFHQIRAQLAAINCPILGDEKYGGQAISNALQIALHAQSLSFFDVFEKKKTRLEAAIPNNDLWAFFK